MRQVDESVPHPRGYGNNARVLGHYVRELKLISLEDAIRKMTSLPAQTFGFRDRGLIREGFAADLVIFDENTISDQATFDKPHQFPLGISYVIVNGAPVIENNQMTAARPGVALFGPGSHKEHFLRKGSKAQRNPLETRQRFAPAAGEIFFFEPIKRRSSMFNLRCVVSRGVASVPCGRSFCPNRYRNSSGNGQ